MISGGVAPNIPLAVQINGGTASSAEIVAGALRDANRAELMGETTYGTGTVLLEFPLTGGSALMLAVEEWLTPDGHSFWHKGLSPEIKVSLPPDAAPLIPSAERDLNPASIKSADDRQLLTALDWVTGQIQRLNHKNEEADLKPGD